MRKSSNLTQRSGDVQPGGFQAAGLNHDWEEKKRKAQADIIANLLPRIPNTHFRRYIAAGGFGFHEDPLNLRRRIKEYIAVCKTIKRYKPKSLYLRGLLDCRREKPSNSVLSLLSRANEEKKVADALIRSFAHLDREQIFFETIIIAVIYGNHRVIRRDAATRIKEFKRQIRNHLSHHAGEREFYNSIMKYGAFELEPYKAADMRDALAENEEKYSDPATRREMYKKAVLMTKLGWLPENREDFYVLHYHGVTNASDQSAYFTNLSRLFPGLDRVDVKKLYANKSVEEHLMYLAGYMLKVAPRWGRLISDGKRRAVLKKKAMLKFIRIHRRFRFRNLTFKLHIGGRRMSGTQKSDGT